MSNTQIKSIVSERTAPRLLGAAFLFVVVTSLSGGLMLQAAAGTGSMSDIMVSISGHESLLRAGFMIDLSTTAGIVILASLLYIVLKKWNRILSLVALGSWLAEAVFLAISRLGALALIPVSTDFVNAGAPVDSWYQSLARFLYEGINQQAFSIHMFFYCVGGVLWYSLFYESRYIPRGIPLYGLIAVSVALAANLFQQAGYDVPLLVSLPLLPFEILIGMWLMLKGIRNEPVKA